MGKRFTLAAITAVALLLAGIAFAVSRLYAPAKSEAGSQIPQEWSVLRAVPSDAVAVFVFDGSAKAAKVLADSTGLIKAAITPDSQDLMAFIQGLSRSKVAQCASSLRTMLRLPAILARQSARMIRWYI